ncbi:MAG: hypothetical protein FD149_1929 [Rhodospirillaceae bacterium]|nr:MAG: hypothetical protein FD149_1929 [Rhodospirillaceae bacterium]
MAAAVFRRGSYLWVVFDRLQETDLTVLRRLGGDVVRDVQQMQHTQATVIRILTESSYNPGVRREGLLWVVDLMPQPLRAKVPIPVKVQPETGPEAHILFDGIEGGTVLSILDPEVGDEMTVVPVIPVGQGVTPARIYPDLELLATVQGIALLSRIDTLNVQSSRNGIEIRASGAGLRLSRTVERAETPRESFSSSIFDIKNWRRGDDYLLEKRRLERDVLAAGNAAARTAPRLALARFEFAHGWGAETLGILGVLAADDPALLNTPAYRALRGGGNFLMSRFEEAVEDLSHASLADNDESALWRAAAEASKAMPEAQAPFLRLHAPLLQDYPSVLKTRLAQVGAEAALAAVDESAAQHFLEMIRAQTDAPQAGILHLTGRYNELTGAFDAALVNYGDVARGTDRYYQPRAALAQTELQLRLGQIKPAEAIKRLDRLRFAWRGDSFEFALLKRLGELHLAEGDHGQGLRVLKTLTATYPEHPETPRIHEIMQAAFDRVYLGEGKEKLSPLAVIALHDEFPELTPTGAKGDEVIRRLADQLVAVDLLDRAAALLDNQVRNRLTGLDKTKVGIRLALVQMLNQQPQKAIDALSSSEGPNLPPDLQLQRRHLMARALADLGRTDDATQLLQNDPSTDGRMLAAEIHWKAKNWGEAAKALGGLVEPPPPGQTLPEEKAKHALDLATALTLAGDERAVMQARRLYLTPLQGTTVYDAFNLITSNGDNTPINPRQVAELAKLAEGFKSFLTAYRDKLKQGKLSDIN